ncbi:unnamed protein product, partial [Mesorhabditis spiculigera]
MVYAMRNDGPAVKREFVSTEATVGDEDSDYNGNIDVKSEASDSALPPITPTSWNCGHLHEHFDNVPTDSAFFPGKKYVELSTLGLTKKNLKVGDHLLLLMKDTALKMAWREARVRSRAFVAVPNSNSRNGSTNGQVCWYQFSQRHGTNHKLKARMNSLPVTPKSRRQSVAPPNQQAQHVIHLSPDVKAITLNMQMPHPTLPDVLNNDLPSADILPIQHTKTITIPANATRVKLVFETAGTQQNHGAPSKKVSRRANCEHRDEDMINVCPISAFFPGKRYDVELSTLGLTKKDLKVGDYVHILMQKMWWRQRYDRRTPVVTPSSNSRNGAPVEKYAGSNLRELAAVSPIATIHVSILSPTHPLPSAHLAPSLSFLDSFFTHEFC